MGRYISAEDHAIVSNAVAAAEEMTSGEIVTVLADRSDGYTDVALLWSIGVSFSLMSLFAVMPQPFMHFWDRNFAGWSHDWNHGELAGMTIALGLIAFVATWAVQYWQPVKFAMIPEPVKTARAHDQAVKHFKVGAERRTHGSTGVLIYLSMREHRAEIVADEPIAAKVPAEVWGEAMADMLSHIRTGRIADGMAAGVRDVGEILTEHFPRSHDDTNELPDRLIEV